MIVPIAHADDPRVADYVNVREAELVKRRGRFLAEGVEVVRTLVLRSRFRARSLFVADRRLSQLEDVLAGLDASVPVYVAPPKVMSEVVGFDIHRGCLAAGDRGPAPELEATLDGLPEDALVVVLEGVANHDNVGGIFRNAACFGAGLVLLDPTCADPLYRKAIRTSMGATLRVPFGRVEPWPEGLAALELRGFTTYALTPRADAENLEDLLADPSRVPRRRALLLGTEGRGLHADTLARVSRWARIPMAPGVDSLNVSTASGVAMWAMRLR